MFVFKVTLNGDCLFNVVLIFFCGNESVVMLLRFLVVGELFFNVSFFVDYDVFIEIIKISIDFIFDTLFFIVLIKAGEEKVVEIRKKFEVVKVEAFVVCIRGKWFLFMDVLGFVFVVLKLLRLIYFDVNFRFWSFIYRSVSSRIFFLLD